MDVLPTTYIIKVESLDDVKFKFMFKYTEEDNLVKDINQTYGERCNFVKQ